MSQQAQGDETEAEEAYQGATQACGDSSDEEDELAVSELRQIEVGGDGKVLQLPDGNIFQVLAFGREEQTAARGDGVRVVSVVLPDARPTGQKKISSLQAEISTGAEGGMSFTSLGKTFNFVNEVPLHATAKKYATSSRIYHDDVLRLGGERDGKPGGGLQEHVYRVNAPALGARPADMAAAATATGAATAAAPAPVARAPAPAASAAAAGGVLLHYCGEGPASAGLECVRLSKGRTLLGSGAEVTCRLPLPAAAKHVTISVSRLGTTSVHAHAALSLTRRDGETHLAAGEQRSVFDGTVLQVAGTSLRFEVPVRQPAAAAAAQPASVASPAQHAPAAAPPVPQPAAERLAGAGLAAGAAIAELTASLTGQAKRREEVRLGLAVQGVLATAAAASEPEERQRQVARQVAGRMSRAENQYDSTKRRERKATRADTSRAAAAAGPSHAATAAAGSSRSRARQHALKTKVRANKRKAADARVGGASAKRQRSDAGAQPPPPPPMRHPHPGRPRTETTGRDGRGGGGKGQGKGRGSGGAGAGGKGFGKGGGKGGGGLPRSSSRAGRARWRCPSPCRTRAGTARRACCRPRWPRRPTRKTC